jgi:hypothetical protein
MNTDLMEEVKKIAKIAELRKTELCKEDNGITDMQSFVVFQHGDMFQCAQSGMDGHPFQALPFVLNDAYNEGTSKFDTVSIVVDSYYKPKAQDADDYKRGDLAQEFKHNPNTVVRECLSVMTYGWDGGSEGMVVEYKYDDRGQPQFTLINENETAQMKSEIVDTIMTSFIKFCKENPQ